MDIKYIRDNEIHEKYILNQLDEKEKQQYEAFLKSSPDAQKELEQTRKLISGIRAAGTSSMRKEIEDQVAALRHPKTDWSVMYKAAAVLFIFVLLPAIFYYQHNFADQQLITEQKRTETYAEPEMEAAEEIAEPGYVVDKDEAQDDISEDLPIEHPAKKIKKSVPVKNEPAAKVSEMPKIKTGRVESIQSGVELNKESASRIDKDMGEGAGGNIVELADMEVLESETIVVESTGNLDDVLNRATTAGVAKSSKSDLPETAKVAAPSRSMGMDYLPSVRTFTFVNQGDTLLMNLNRIHLKDAFPDFIKVNIKEDSLNQINLDIFVSDQLHSVKKEDINVEWQKNNLIHIIFSENVIYKVKLEEKQKTAQKVK